MQHAITDLASLESLYGPVAPRSLLKVRQGLDAPSRAFIEASPFCVLSTRCADGRVHGTPRGDGPGFVAVLSDTEIALPDRRGNNRIDALRDIVADPQVSLLFFVPGLGETLRVHGRATITTDPGLRARLAVQGKLPVTVLHVAVGEVFMQCSRALVRSRLWAGRDAPPEAPTAGQLMDAATGGAVQAGEYDTGLRARIADSLY